MPENEKFKPQIDPARALAASYPSNSNKKKAEEANKEQMEKKVERLEGVTAVKKKPAWGKRLRAAFTGDDARGIGDYLLFEVAIPAIKTTLFDLINQGANRALFGQGGGAPGAANRRPGVVNYNQISRQQSQQPRAVNLSQQERSTHNFDGIVLPTRADADKVVGALMDLIEQYNVAAVSDLYDLVGITGSFTDDRWGWYELGGTRIIPVRDGFAIDLPPTQPLR